MNGKVEERPSQNVKQKFHATSRDRHVAPKEDTAHNDPEHGHAKIASDHEKNWETRQEFDCFSNHAFNSRPWITGPGIKAHDFSISRTKDFFSYNSKNVTNVFGGALVAVKSIRQIESGSECELPDGRAIKCSLSTCEFEISAVSGGILVGVAADDVDLGSNWLEDERVFNRVWFYASPLGRFFNGPHKISNKKVQCNPEFIRPGDRVAIQVDIPLKLAAVLVNGKLCGKIPYVADLVRPAVFFFGKGSSVSLKAMHLHSFDHDLNDDLTEVDSSTAEDSTIPGLWTRWHPAITIIDSTDIIYSSNNTPTPSYSSISRTNGAVGPCTAVLAYFAATSWGGRSCTGKALSAEFSIKQRQGSMEIGVISSKLPLSGTWCDKTHAHDAYWYSWSGAIRKGSELMMQTSRRFFEGDVVRIEIDLLLGRVGFFLNNQAVGKVVVEAVDAVRRQEQSILEMKKGILLKIANITALKKEVERGRLALTLAVNSQILDLREAQADASRAAAKLREMTDSCSVELHPAVSMCRAGDRVQVDGSVAFHRQEAEPDHDALATVPDLERAAEPVPMLSEIEYGETLLRLKDALARSRSLLLGLLGPDELDVLVDGYHLQLDGEAPLVGGDGQAPGSLYLLLHGQLSVRVQGAVGLREVVVLGECGATFGELAVTGGKRFKASIHALCPSSVFEFSKDLLRKIFVARPEILLSFDVQTRDRVAANSNAGEPWRSMFVLHQDSLGHPLQA